MFFPSYRFEHPITGRMIRIYGFSYVLAALGGPLYVAAVGRRMRGILTSILASVIIGVGVVVVFGFAMQFLDSAKAIITLAALVPAAIAIHGRTTIFVLREDLRRRGWIINLD